MEAQRPLSSARLFLGIDQGTSGTAVAAFDEQLKMVAHAERPTMTTHPQAGRSEQDPHELLTTIVDAVAEVVSQVGGCERIAAAGLANQGESITAWDARSGKAMAPVVLWSDDRGLPIIEQLEAAGLAPAIERATGLPASPYFSAAKAAWLLQHHDGVRTAHRAGRLRLGTLDSWFARHLGGGDHVTDDGTASRTQLFSLDERGWDETLLHHFGVPRDALPQARASVGDLGSLAHPAWGGAIPWRSSVVDQPAALAGNGCFAAGEIKVTYGTGCFVVMNAGSQRPNRVPGLATSLAWTAEPALSGATLTYAVDGGVFSCGSALRWLCDHGLLARPQDASAVAGSVADSGGIRFLPALDGLGAPWWKPRCRAVLTGLSSGTAAAHIVRAALDSIALRVCDILDALWSAGYIRPHVLRVDGGLTNCTYLMQRQADLTGMPIEIAAKHEATALGAAALAALAEGAIEPARVTQAQRAAGRFEPAISCDQRRSEYAHWRAWLERVCQA